MSKVIAIINEIPANKKGIEIFAKALIEPVINGEVDPLNIRKRIDAIEKIIKTVKNNKEFKQNVQAAAEQWTEKTFEHEGVVFTKTLSTTYDYSEDPVYQSIQKKISELNGQKKDREKLLSGLSEATEVNGVVCYPPAKLSSDVVRVNFK